MDLVGGCSSYICFEKIRFAIIYVLQAIRICLACNGCCLEVRVQMDFGGNVRPQIWMKGFVSKNGRVKLVPAECSLATNRLMQMTKVSTSWARYEVKRYWGRNN